jgi:hypothetical protein
MSALLQVIHDYLQKIFVLTCKNLPKLKSIKSETHASLMKWLEEQEGQQFDDFVTKWTDSFGAEVIQEKTSNTYIKGQNLLNSKDYRN